MPQPSEVALVEEANLRSKARDESRTLEDSRSQSVALQVHDEDGGNSGRPGET